MCSSLWFAPTSFLVWLLWNLSFEGLGATFQNILGFGIGCSFRLEFAEWINWIFSLEKIVIRLVIYGNGRFSLLFSCLFQVFCHEYARMDENFHKFIGWLFVGGQMFCILVWGDCWISNFTSCSHFNCYSISLCFGSIFFV